MGQVFLCEHKLMRRRVAVKVLPINKANDPSSLERFYREARAAGSLGSPSATPVASAADVKVCASPGRSLSTMTIWSL